VEEKVKQEEGLKEESKQEEGLKQEESKQEECMEEERLKEGEEFWEVLPWLQLKWMR
jgi:hypothetical protein